MSTNSIKHLIKDSMNISSSNTDFIKSYSKELNSIKKLKNIDKMQLIEIK